MVLTVCIVTLFLILLTGFVYSIADSNGTLEQNIKVIAVLVGLSCIAIVVSISVYYNTLTTTDAIATEAMKARYGDRFIEKSSFRMTFFSKATYSYITEDGVVYVNVQDGNVEIMNENGLSEKTLQSVEFVEKEYGIDIDRDLVMVTKSGDRLRITEPNMEFEYYVELNVEEKPLKAVRVKKSDSIN